jgi:restriction endonuclease S subunit
LGDIATFEYGYTISATDRGEFRLIRITDIDEYGNIWDKDIKYVDLANEADKEKYLLKEGDIIMARIGSVGETAIFQIKKKAIFASYLIRINLDKRVILPKYYWYFVKTPEYWKQVEQLTKGTVQPQFNANSLKEIRVPIPSLENQRGIIEERERDLAIINYQKQSLQLLKEKQQKFLNNLW